MCVTRPEQVSFIKKLLCDVYYVFKTRNRRLHPFVEKTIFD